MTRLNAGAALIVDRAVETSMNALGPIASILARQIGHVTDDRDAAAIECFDQELIGETVAVPIWRDHSAVEPFDHAGVGAVAVEVDGDGCKSLSLDRPQNSTA